MSSNLRTYVTYSASIAVFFLVWYTASHTIFNPKLVPPPDRMFANVWDLAESGEGFEHIWASLRRVGVGYVLGSLAGIGMGTLIGLYRIADDLLEPPLQFVRNITPVAVVPLAIHAFGLDETSKYFVIFYGTIIPVIFNTATGVAGTPKIRIRAAMCLGANQRDIFFRVVIPSAWPYIVTGLRVGLGFSFMGVVAAEMIAADEGVGFLIMQSRNMFLPQQMFTGLFLLGLMGMATDRGFRYLLNRLMRRYMMMLSTDH